MTLFLKLGPLYLNPSYIRQIVVEKDLYRLILKHRPEHLDRSSNRFINPCLEYKNGTPEYDYIRNYLYDNSYSNPYPKFR